MREIPRFLLELLNSPRFHGQLSRLLVVAGDGQRTLSAAIEIGVAAAVEIVLSDRIGVHRLLT